MKIAIVQHDIHGIKCLDDLKHIGSLIAKRPNADMYVLPETFATGFMPECCIEDIVFQNMLILS